MTHETTLVLAELPEVQIKGTWQLSASNLADITKAVKEAIARINTNPQTDDEFGHAEKTIKWCEKGEEKLKDFMKKFDAEVQSVDLTRKELNEFRVLLRDTRLDLEKAVKKGKDAKRQSIIMEGYNTLLQFLTSENKRIGYDMSPPNYTGMLEFSGKGKPSLKSFQDSVNQEVEKWKIKITEKADNIKANLDVINAVDPEYKPLVNDIGTLVTKPIEDLRDIIDGRILKEKSRIAKIESNRLEKEQRERQRLDKLELDKLEKDRLTQIESERIESIEGMSLHELIGVVNDIQREQKPKIERVEIKTEGDLPVEVKGSIHPYSLSNQSIQKPVSNLVMNKDIASETRARIHSTIDLLPDNVLDKVELFIDHLLDDF